MIFCKQTAHFRLLFLLVLLWGAACTGQSALPQVSLPPPANDCGSGGGCIIGSAPSTNGFVTVTGSGGAVPGGAVIEAEVPGSSSSWDKFLDSLCPNAYAIECSSDLPLCTDEESDGCHIVAGEDGSFLLQIKAKLGDTIRIIYINPEDCRESEAFELTVTNDFAALNLEGKVLTDNSLDTAYIFGLNPDGENQIVSVDIPLVQSPDAASDVDIEGNPEAANYLPTTNDLVLVTLDNAGLFDLDGESEDVAKLDLDITEVGLLAHQAVVDKGFTYPELFNSDGIIDFKFSCLEDPTSLSLQTVDRIFFSRQITPETNTYPIALFDGFVDPMGTSYTVRGIHYGFERTELEGATLLSVRDIFISLQGTKAFFLGEFDVEGVSRFYLVEIPLDGTALCSGVEASAVTLIALPEEMTAPGKSLFFGSFPDFAGEADGILLIPDKGGTVFAVNLTTGKVIDDLTITPLTSSRLDGLFEIMPAAFPDTYPLNFFGIGNSTLFPAMLELTSPMTDSLLATEIESNEIIGFTPVDLELFTTTDFKTLNDPSLFDGSFLILSEGFPDDGMSLLREVPLGDL